MDFNVIGGKHFWKQLGIFFAQHYIVAKPAIKSVIDVAQITPIPRDSMFYHMARDGWQFAPPADAARLGLQLGFEMVRKLYICMVCLPKSEAQNTSLVAAWGEFVVEAIDHVAYPRLVTPQLLPPNGRSFFCALGPQTGSMHPD